MDEQNNIHTEYLNVYINTPKKGVSKNKIFESLYIF